LATLAASRNAAAAHQGFTSLTWLTRASAVC